MVTLARTSSGLLYRSDGSLTGWSGPAQWSSVAAVRLVASPSVPISPGAIFNQNKGEPKLESVGGTWYYSYDDLLINGQSTPAFQTSTDRGITWADRGPIRFAAALPNAGLAITSFFLDPVSSAWHVLALDGPTLSATGDGLAGPNQGYIFRSSGDITGPYTQINKTLPVAGSWADTWQEGGSIVYDGTNYQYFCTGANPFPVAVQGIFTSTSLSGPFTQPSPSTPLYDITVNGPTGITDGNGGAIEGIENTAYGYNPVLGFYMIAGNLDAFGDAEGYSWGTAVQTSTTPTGFPTSGWKVIQWVNPADANVILDVTQFMHAGPNSQLATGPNGEFVAICSSQVPGGPFSPRYQRLRTAVSVIEPATAVLRYAGSADTTLRGLSRSIAHTDITVELASEQTGLNSGGVGSIAIAYRSDGSGNNEYRATLAVSGKWSLVKVVAGTPTTVATGTGTQTYDNKGAAQGLIHRLKVQVVGNVHTASLDGEAQYSFTDSTSPFVSGTTVTVYGQGVNCDIINLSCRTSDTITVNGMQPNTSCWLRAACGIPIAPIVANSSGVGTISYGHFPLYSLDIAGTDYTVGSDSRIWGGDTLQWSGLPSSPPAIPNFVYFA